MDSLTQIVLGAAVAEKVLGKKIGNKAMLYGAIAGTIPDLDVISKFFVDPIRANELHRGFSHSILFCLLAAPILGWLVSKIEFKFKDVSWRDWSKLFFWGLFTHPLLDAHTAWGTQLFWPFDLRVAYKNIFVVDPLYTVPFLVFVILAMCYKRTNPKRTKFNNWGLIVSSAYMVLTIIFKGIGFYNVQKSLQDQGIAYMEIETRPSPLNSILWSAIVETEEAYLIGNYSLLDGRTPVTFITFPKNYHLLGPAANESIIHRLIFLSQDMYIVECADNNQLYFNDLRFGQSGMDDAEAEFIYSYKLDYVDGVLMATERPKTFEEGGKLLSELWVRIKGR